jgi:hypothetical protein
LLETEDFADDPRSSDPKTGTAIADIGERVPPIDALTTDVEAALEAMTNADDQAKHAAHAKTALQAIAAFRSKIDTIPLLTEMENTEAGSFPIHSKIVSVLDNLASALRA